jgi:hypothetical protein
MLFFSKFRGYLEKVNAWHTMYVQHQFQMCKIYVQCVAYLFLSMFVRGKFDRKLSEYGDGDCEKLIQEFCTRIFAFYMLTKDKTTKTGTHELQLLLGPCCMLQVSLSIRLCYWLVLQIPVEVPILTYNCACTCGKHIDHMWCVTFNTWSKLPTFGGNTARRQKHLRSHFWVNKLNFYYFYHWTRQKNIFVMNLYFWVFRSFRTPFCGAFPA